MISKEARLRVVWEDGSPTRMIQRTTTYFEGSAGVSSATRLRVIVNTCIRRLVAIAALGKTPLRS